jgi:tetratricopeptide (TPR) repeat protein
MLAIVMSVVVAVATAPARAPTRPAAEAAERALVHYEAGRYDEARSEIARAYMIEPWPEFLFARAQIERADGDCTAAREFYDLYLDADPPERGAKLAADGIAACPVRPPPPRVDPTDGAPADARRTKVVRDIGIASTAFGGAALVAATVLYAVGRAQQRSAAEAQNHGVFGARIDRAERLGVAGTAAVSVGAILTTAGVVQLVVASRQRRAHDGRRASR